MHESEFTDDHYHKEEGDKDLDFLRGHKHNKAFLSKVSGAENKTISVEGYFQRRSLSGLRRRLPKGRDEEGGLILGQGGKTRTVDKVRVEEQESRQEDRGKDGGEGEYGEEGRRGVQVEQSPGKRKERQNDSEEGEKELEQGRVLREKHGNHGVEEQSLGRSHRCTKPIE